MFQESKKFFASKLETMRKEAEERAASLRAKKGNYPYIDLKTAPINIEAVGMIPEAEAREAKVAAIEIKADRMAITAFDPDDEPAKKIIDELKTKGYKLSVFTTSLNSLGYVWEFYKYIVKERGKISGEINIAEERLLEYEKSLTSVDAIRKRLSEMNSDGSYTGEFLEVIMAGALGNDASDIHLEPAESEVKFRLRVDGILHDAFSDIKKSAYLFILSRIKLISGLKINIHEEPQDGRFSIKMQDKEIDVRVAIAPSAYGEVVVMRLLDPKNINVSLSDLGFRDDDLETIKRELANPNGMILNTGPTGSGKTTTLYTFLRHKNTPEIKIITIEDPIEYRLAGIEQTQVKKEAGYTFASGLSSLLRQDPDVILVGEIRDKETAEISIQAALTGHLVFSTVHANEAAGAIPRILDLGVRASSIGPALNLVIAQRLVRKLCKSCRAESPISDDERKKFENFIAKLPERVKGSFSAEKIKTYKPVGCEKCNSFGYKGRLGLFELFMVDAAVENMINKEIGEANLRAFAVGQGMITLQQDGILKVLAGETTFEEIESATGIIDWGNNA